MLWSLPLLTVIGQCFFVSCRLYEYHLIEENKTWDQAQAYCREKYTDLASVSDMNDAKRISELERQTGAWIGLHSNQGAENKRWHWSMPELPEVEFSDIQTYFSPGEPNDVRGNENCVEVKNKELNDEKCSSKREFICFNDKVVLVKENKTWEEALDYCREEYDDLVSIKNDDDQKWVQERVKNALTPHVWLGLRYTCTLGFWFWISNEAVNYTNWAEGEEANGCDMSGAMATSGDHKWYKQQDEQRFNFLCSKC